MNLKAEKKKQLKEVLIQVRQNWMDAYQRALDVTPMSCGLCRFFDGECNNCIAQKLCNGLSEPRGGGGYYKGERTLWGKIVEAENNLTDLMLKALKKLNKLIEEAE